MLKPINLDPYKNLTIICNGCGEPMRHLGEWPISYPKPEQDKPKNVQQTIRYICKTCRTPCEGYESGVPVGVSILGPEADQ